MGIEHPGGPDNGPEADKPTRQDNTTPPDNPGSTGQPSRVESLRAAGWELKSQPETGTEQGNEREQSTDESSTSEPADGEQDDPADPKTEKEAETEETPPDGRSERPGTADAGELTPAPDTGGPGEPENQKTEPSSAESTLDEGDAQSEPQAAEGWTETGESQPEAGEVVGAGRTDGRGDEPRSQDSGAIAPESSDEREPSETSEVKAEDEPTRVPTDQQDGHNNTEQPAEDQGRVADNPEQADKPSIQLAWAPANEGVARWTTPAVQFGEVRPGSQPEDRGRNGQEQPGRRPPDRETTPDSDQPQAGTGQTTDTGEAADPGSPRLDEKAIREQIDPHRPNIEKAEGRKEDFERTVRDDDGEWTEGVDRVEELPTGEKLAEAEDEKSKADKFRKTTYENYSTISRRFEGLGKTLDQAFGPRPTGHAETRSQDGPVMADPHHSGVDAGSAASSLLAAGIVGAEMVRWARAKAKERNT